MLGASKTFNLDIVLCLLLVNFAGCINTDRTNQNDGCYGDKTSDANYNFTCNARRIFVTVSTFNGNLGGVAGANNKCNSDAGRPDTTKQYAAYILPGGATLLDDYRYNNTANNKLGTALAGSLNYPLENSINATATQVWTGANSTNCFVWTVGNNGNNGTYGIANATSNSYFNSDQDTCDKFKSLYCLEQ